MNRIIAKSCPNLQVMDISGSTVLPNALLDFIPLMKNMYPSPCFGIPFLSALHLSSHLASFMSVYFDCKNISNLLQAANTFIGATEDVERSDGPIPKHNSLANKYN